LIAMTFDTSSRAHKGLAVLIATMLVGSTAAGAMATTPPRPGPGHVAVARIVAATPPTHAAPTTTGIAG
jgi:hypothetical protein